MVIPQVSLLNLTLDAGVPGDVMWSLIYGNHIVSVLHHDGFFDGGTEDLFDAGEDNQVKEDGRKRWTSFCPDQSVAFDFGTPRSHEIKDESGVISKGWYVWDVLSSGFIN